MKYVIQSDRLKSTTKMNLAKTIIVGINNNEFELQFDNKKVILNQQEAIELAAWIVFNCNEITDVVFDEKQLPE